MPDDAADKLFEKQLYPLMSGGSPASGCLARCVSHSPITSGFSGVLCIAVFNRSNLCQSPVMFRCQTEILSLLGRVSSSIGSRPLAVKYVLGTNPNVSKVAYLFRLRPCT